MIEKEPKCAYGPWRGVGLDARVEGVKEAWPHA